MPNILQSTGTSVTFNSNLTPELYLYNPAAASSGNEPSAWSRFVVRLLQPTVKVRGLVNETVAPHGEARTDLSPFITGGMAIGFGLAAYGAWRLLQDVRAR